MTHDTINYGALIDEAMQIIVRKSLYFATEQSLPGDHHFYISFLTTHKGVRISERIKAQYPKEMTIVLQHQFDNLEVNEQGFSVSLSFNDVMEDITVPYDALTAFADPSVKFGLQFRKLSEKHPYSDDAHGNFSNVSDESPSKKTVKNISIKSTLRDAAAHLMKKNNKTTPHLVDTDLTPEKTKKPSNVVTLDSFRKKDPKKK
jgi:hypothetical protein